MPVRDSDEDSDEPANDYYYEEDESAAAPRQDLITFSYYPINQRFDQSGSLVYEIEDNLIRTGRGGWGKGKKKKCKKGKKKKVIGIM